MMEAETLAKFESAGVPVHLFRLKDSELQVCHILNPGPIAHAFFVIATEAHDDDGLPHTLEHLVFLGSENYPFKGVLDSAANRLFARGTNAWTAVDSTVYTASHAGGDGLLALLPVFADHVLWPTITKSGYVTEVHHINGDGEDAGVVYCEMTARENNSYSITRDSMRHLMWPGSGYSAETGGKVAALRSSCSWEKVAAYHRQFYRPSGVCLVVVGGVTEAGLLGALQPVHEKILSKGKGFWPEAERAWSGPQRVLSETVRASVEFPSDDESTGLVRVEWHTVPLSDTYTRSALDTLLTYFTDTSVSELKRAFVECAPPLAGAVYPSGQESNPATCGFTIDSVPKEKLGDIEGRLMEVLSAFASGAGGEFALDPARMALVLRRRRLDVLDSAEGSPESSYTMAVIVEFLHGDGGGGALEEAMDELARISRMEKEQPAFWLALAKRFLVDAPRAVVVGTPSSALGAAMAKAETERIAAQRAALGPEKLEALGAALAEATKQNDTPFPEAMLRQFAVPPVENITTHRVATLRSALVAPAAKGEPALPAPPAELAADAALVSALGVAAQFDDVQSAFVEVSVTVRTGGLPAEQRALVPLVLALLFESPVRRGGSAAEVTPHAEVVRAVADATLSAGASLGFGGGRFGPGAFGELACVSARAAADRYAEVVALLADCVFGGVVAAERVKVQIAKALAAVPQFRRDGGSNASAVLRSMAFAEGGNKGLVSFVRQARVLQRLQARLETPEGAASVVSELEAVRAALFGCPGRVCVHAASRLAQLRQPTVTAPWEEKFIPAMLAFAAAAAAASPPPPHGATRVECSGEQLSGKTGLGVVVGNSAVESGFLEQSGPGVFGGFEHPHLAPLMVAIEYLTGLEGPFWKQIRGRGLAYSYGISASPEDGLVNFNLFKAAHVSKAYAASHAIVKGFADGTTKFDEVTLETAISSTVFAIINREKTATAAGKQSLYSFFRGVGGGYNRRLVDSVRAVTAADALAALSQYLLPLFDPAATNCAICVNPNKVQEVTADFAALGRALTVAESVDAAFPEEPGSADAAGGRAEENAECKAEALRAAGGKEAEQNALKCACVRCRGPFTLPSAGGGAAAVKVACGEAAS